MRETQNEIEAFAAALARMDARDEHEDLKNFDRQELAGRDFGAEALRQEGAAEAPGVHDRIDSPDRPLAGEWTEEKDEHGRVTGRRFHQYRERPRKSTDGERAETRRILDDLRRQLS